MKLLSLSMLIGFGLIAFAIFFKPVDPALACDNYGCAFLKGKYIYIWQNEHITKVHVNRARKSSLRVLKEGE